MSGGFEYEAVPQDLQRRLSYLAANMIQKLDLEDDVSPVVPSPSM
jgi:hypothetical protein